MRRPFGATYELDLPMYLGGKTQVGVPIEKMSEDAVKAAMPMVRSQVSAMMPELIDSAAQQARSYVPEITRSAADAAIPMIADTVIPEIIERSWPSMRWKIVQVSALTTLVVGALGLAGMAVYKKSKSRVR